MGRAEGRATPPYDFLTLLQKSQFKTELVRTFAERKHQHNLLVNKLAGLLEPSTEFTRLAITNIETRNLTASTVQFTNMALTFQRLDGAYRAKGLDLFERLLDIGVHDAFMTLQELDKRLPSLAPPVRRPLPRRRRQGSPA